MVRWAPVCQLTVHQGAHWPTGYCTYRGNWQPAGVGVEGSGHREHRQPDRQRAHIEGHVGTLEHCQLSIQGAQPTNQTRGTQWGAVNSTFRGHRQPIRQGAHDSATAPGSDQKKSAAAIPWPSSLFDFKSLKSCGPRTIYEHFYCSLQDRAICKNCSHSRSVCEI